MSENFPFPYISQGWDRPDPYLWDYEQSRQFNLAEAIQNVMVESKSHFDAYSKLIRKSREKQLALIHQITENVVKTQDHFKGLARKEKCETFWDTDLVEPTRNNLLTTETKTVGLYEIANTIENSSMIKIDIQTSENKNHIPKTKC